MTSLLAFSVGLVSIFGVWRDEDTRFPDFEAAIKKLFWIIFDPGKEEYTDIGPQETDCPEKEVPEGHSEDSVDRISNFGFWLLYFHFELNSAADLLHNIKNF